MSLSNLGWLSADARWLLAGRGVRGFGYGFMGVLLAVYLAAAGQDAATIGFLFGISLGGATVLTLLSGPLSVRYGRRALLVGNALLMGLAALVFAATDHIWLLALAAVTGTVNVSGAERGAFITVEQAALPQTAPDHRRTDVFAAASTVGSIAAALGALAAGLPGVLERELGLATVDAVRLMLLAYAGLALVSVGTTLRLTPAIEVTPEAVRTTNRLGISSSGGRIARLSALGFVDSFGSGFILQSFIAYWFYTTHGLTFEKLGGLFAVAALLEAASFWTAVWLSKRIGLVNTMVFTHIPANLLLMALPFMPSAELAVLAHLLRTALSQMDVPTRQSYMMAVVQPEERVSAASLERMARGAGMTVSPMIAGAVLQAAAAAVPFVLGGGIKAAYDVAMWFAFRNLKPPEEAGKRPAAR